MNFSPSEAKNMQAKVKNAVVMTLTVLAVIYVMRKVPVASRAVDIALAG